MERPNVVVVGYGFAGRCFHTYLVNLAADLNLYGVVSSRAQARAQIEADLGVVAYSDFDQVVTDDDVDLVVLATPNDLHAPYSIRALEAGKHVVTDKPMALDLKEADAMIAASRTHDRLLSVFQNRRWDADFLTVRKAIEQGRIGDLFQIEMAWMSDSPPRTWRGESAHGGGKFVDLGAHMIDQALLLVPSPAERVYARFHTRILDNDVEDHSHCVITFAGGVDVHIATSSAAAQVKPRWLVLGAEGVLRQQGLDPQEASMIARDIDAAGEVAAHRTTLTRPGTDEPQQLETVPGRWRSYYENVADALYGRTELAVTAESVRRVMEIIDAAKRSAAVGRAIDIGDGAGP